MFIGTIPSVCRENIEALLSTDNNTDDKVSSDSIVDQAAIDDDDETTHFQNHEMSDANEDDNEAEENNDGDIDDDDDDDVNATREDDNAAVIGSCSVVGDVPLMIGPFSNSFTAEVELSHLLRKKGCNLNLFKPVFGWAIQSQKCMGFDFVTMQTPVQTRLF